ncbi:MAG: S41 family peptidase [Oscillospiraceae bacterium]|nr:S41 family peptidase [Oscillospiraceae bacterium]
MSKWKLAAALAVTAVTASFLTLAVILFTVDGLTASRTAAPYGAVAQKVSQIEELIETYFVDEYDTETIGDYAADAMIEALDDPWSYYIPASEADAVDEEISNSYSGVGANVYENDDGKYEITFVTEGSPAEAAGLLVGDVIVRVDGQSVDGMTLEEVVAQVRGEEGTTVTLTVLRGDQTLELPVKRGSIRLTIVSGDMLDGGIGYILIDNFEEDSYSQFSGVLRELMANGAKGLIIDVRFNPGGMQDQLVPILDTLLPEGVIFRCTDYDGTETVDTSDSACVDLPMAVLVNADSVSAAEFFAAAMQEYDRAVIVGEKTGGKGNFQYIFELDDGSAVALSSGKYYTPSGKSLSGVGVQPDITVRMSDEQN